MLSKFPVSYNLNSYMISIIVDSFKIVKVVDVTKKFYFRKYRM